MLPYSDAKVLIDGLNNRVYVKKTDVTSLIPIKVECDPKNCSAHFGHITYNNDPYNIKLKMPLSVGISLTNRCNLSCNYCSFDSKTQGDELSFSQVKTFVNWFVKNAIIRKKMHLLYNTPKIYFAGGGEPTYNWALLTESVEYIREVFARHGIPVFLGITTNGVLNTNQVVFLESNFDSIMVSYDGNPETQNKNRCSSSCYDTHEFVYKTLKYLDSIKFNFSIRTTIWPDDYGLLTKMANYISTEFPNLRSWDIEPVMPEGRAKKHASSYNNFVKEYVRLEEHVYLHKLPINFRSSYFKQFISCDNCGAAYGNNPWLDASGRILNCLDDHNSNIVLGNIQNEQLEFFDVCDNISSQHYSDYYQICKNCIAFIHCGGGCPLRAKEAPQMFAQQCECKRLYWKQYYEKLINDTKYNNKYLKLVKESPEYLVYEIAEQ